MLRFKGENSQIAYSLGLGAIPGVISSPGALVADPLQIASPATPAVPTSKVAQAVAAGTQAQNTSTGVDQLPANSDNDKSKAVGGLIGTVVVFALIILVLK